ncbi:hypothetical protein POTOM_006601 [Populus tomentosa]|uniref:Uncharacterized protein n=1 Tax=Populus tomentosa TaxID=118781 RepID=A0A8X8DF97_POPTO|nr:hypothetical protein POTOM_006601 [Populus tomentosa]
MLRHFIKGKDLIRPAATRFATAYLTLGCLSDCKIQLMTMFTSIQWRSCRFSKTEEGKRIQSCVLDSKFWHDVTTCIKAAYPLIKVLRLVDSDEKLVMGFPEGAEALGYCSSDSDCPSRCPAGCTDAHCQYVAEADEQISNNADPDHEPLTLFSNKRLPPFRTLRFQVFSVCPVILGTLLLVPFHGSPRSPSKHQHTSHHMAGLEMGSQAQSSGSL